MILQRVAGELIGGAVDGCVVDVVEHIEAVADELQVIFLSNGKVFLQTQIKDLSGFQLLGIAAQLRQEAGADSAAIEAGK